MTTGPRRVAALLAALLAALGAAQAAPHVPLDGDPALDRQSVAVLEALLDGETGQATALAAALVRRHPRFALGQLLHAELAAAAALDTTLVGSDRPWSPALIELLLEARARLDAARARRRRPEEALPAALVQLGPHTESVVFVDLGRGVLTLFDARGDDVLRAREHYVSSGAAGFGKRREGDRRTPLGVYRIDGVLADAILPELYGSGALTLDYPNALDRLLGRTGHGIWLHGVPRSSASRGPRSSEGCVTMSNGHLDALRERLDPARSLVVLAADTRVTSSAAHAATLRDHRALFARYRRARLAAAAPPRELRPRDGAPLALTPAAREALAAAPLDDLTIIETAPFGDAPASLVTEVALDAGGIGTVALWWIGGADGRWRLALEQNLAPRPPPAKALKNRPARPLTLPRKAGHAQPADAGAIP